MKRLFLLLLMLKLITLSIQQDSKLKLRMDVMGGITYNGGSNIGMKRTLLMFTEKFEFDQAYTRMAAMNFDYEIINITSLTDDRNTVVSNINTYAPRDQDSRSILDAVLKQMLAISKAQGRKDALKVFIVLTDKFPTSGDAEANYQSARPIAKEIKSNGLFFIVYDSHKTPKPEPLKYFKELCGEENFIFVQKFIDIEKRIEETVFPKILSRACERRKRLCKFVDSTRQTCQSVWLYTKGLLPSENCRKVGNNNSPFDCKYDECLQHCDKHWPWEKDADKCSDCSIKISRRGNVPFADLATCEKFRTCAGCDDSHFSEEDEEEADGTSAGGALGAIGIIFVVAVAGVGSIAFAAMKFAKPGTDCMTGKGDRPNSNVSGSILSAGKQSLDTSAG